MTIYTEPCVSGEAVAYLMVALILTCFALVLFGFTVRGLVSIAMAYKDLSAGRRLREASLNDEATVEMWIEAARCGNDILHDQARIGLSEFRVRQARFNGDSA